MAGQRVTPVIYRTKDGKNATGYIIDGKTYKDPAGNTRVDVGSTVPTAGGVYTLTEMGSVKTPASVQADLAKGYADARASLDDAYAAKRRAVKAATDKALYQIERSKSAAESGYADANREAYHAYINASNPYGAAEEQRSKIGLSNSGYAESSKMKLADTYQRAIGDNARAKNQYLSELEDARRAAIYNGEIEAANAINEYAKLVYQHGINAAEKLAEQSNYAYKAGIEADESAEERKRYAAEQARLDRQEKAALENEQWERNFKTSQEMFDRQYKNSQLAIARANAARKSASSSSSKKEDTWERARKLAALGIATEEIAAELGISLQALRDGIYGSSKRRSAQ